MKIAHISLTGSLLGWYDSIIHKNIPTPNVEVADTQWAIAVSEHHNTVSQDGLTSFVQPELTPEKAVEHFKAFTNAYIQLKVDDWNTANAASGIRFDDILSFPKYAAIPTDSRYAVSIQFLTWNGRIWDTATAYMLSATIIPTEAEFKAILDSVPF